MRSHAKAGSAGSTEGNGAGRGLIRRGVAALAGAGSLALVVALVAVPAASAAPWGFEQVTPPVKGAGTVAYVDTFRASPDGESFLYTTGAPFTSIPSDSSPAYTRYIGHRGPKAWENVSLDPPFETIEGSGAQLYIQGVIGSSYNLEYVVVASQNALTPGATEGGGNVYMRNTRTRELTLIATSTYKSLSALLNGNQGSTSLSYVAPDGKSALFMAPMALAPGAPENGATPSQGAALYSWTASGGIKAASVLPASEGGAIVKVAAGPGNTTESGPRDSMAYEGGLDHIYFRVWFENGELGGVYVRSGEETKPVSYSRIPGDPSTVVGASPDSVTSNGKYLLFHTDGPTRLTEDTPTDLSGSILYRYDVSDGSLDYIGPNSGAFQMTQDGQTIAFTSEKAAAPGAVEGQPNLYVWRNGTLKLAATTDPGSSATSGPWSLHVLSRNGRYLSFTDNSVSLAQGFGQDNTNNPGCPIVFVGTPGPCDEAYVFDADATSDALQCASCREDGAPQRGNAGDPLNQNSAYVRMDSHQAQTVGNDGTVFFTTADGLLPSDKNELEDVYAYNDGSVRLVSRATPGAFARFLDGSSDGKTAFFSTNDAIVGTDTDRSVDVYMTREGAGYPYTPPVVTPPCVGAEGCHGGVPSRSSQTSPGSSSFQGRGNEKPRSRKGGDRVTVIKPRPATGSNGALKVKAPGKGKLTVSGPGVKKVTKSVSKAGTYTVKVTLTPAATKALEKSGQTERTLKVVFKPSGGKASSATVKLTFKASAGKKGGRRS